MIVTLLGVYDYCKINLLSLRTMLNFVDNFSPAYGKKRGRNF